MSSGGNKVVDLWRDQKSAQGQSGTSREELTNPYAYSDEDEDDIRPGRWRKPLALALCGGGALLWVGALAYSRYQAFVVRGATLDDILSLIALAATPLALLALVWLLIQRSARAEADSFARTAGALRTESQRLETMLAFVSARIEASRRDLAEQSDSLLTIGEDATTRLNTMTDAMRKEIETISGHANTLKGSAAAARGDLAVLLSQLPKTQVQMRQITQMMAEAGSSATLNTISLKDELDKLNASSERASEIADGTAVFLGEQIERMQALTAEMATMVADSQAALNEAGGATSDMVAARVRDIGTEIDRIATVFAAQDVSSRELATRMESDIGAIESRFAAFNASGTDQSEKLGSALESLKIGADAVSQAFDQGGLAADALSGKADGLVERLAVAAKHIDETLPLGLEQIGTKSAETMRLIDASVPALAAAAQSASTALANVQEAEALVSKQKQAFDDIAQSSTDQVNATRVSADELAALVRQTTAETEALATSAGPALIDALLRAKETARIAVDHSRTAFAEVIPQAAAELGAQSKAALSAALTEQVEAQIAEIAATTERAVTSAQAATDRLMRQMLTISETSAALEARIAEAKEESETADHSNFARRVALLIESLNSTAIDVTKILSNDVTDSAWAAYLRGDRGIFSRRAVRLLDASEAKELARHYQDDSEFREQVNRYIHDYEAMLRNVMSTRDGAPLSVALLSSDTGKLYVALAQAIERLRR
jgi:hypothetical protein